MQGQCGGETAQARKEKAQLPRSPLCQASLCGLSLPPQSFVCMTELSLQALCRRFQGAILAVTKVCPEGRGPAGRVLGAARSALPTCRCLSPRPAHAHGGAAVREPAEEAVFFFILGFSLLLLLFSVSKTLKGPSLFSKEMRKGGKST